MSFDNVLASLAVKDLKSAIEWYTRLLGRAPDSTPMPEVAEWRFPRGGWLQVYQAPDRAGQGSCTLAVSRIDDAVAAAAGLGADTSDRNTSARVKTLMITDPDGNHIAMAEALDPTMAR